MSDDVYEGHMNVWTGRTPQAGVQAIVDRLLTEYRAAIAKAVGQ